MTPEPFGSLPRLSVLYLQSESEMLRVPDQDLGPFFARTDRWKAELLTERQARGLLDTASAYDCLVVGYNALHDSSSIRAALSDGLPRTGALVLHQLVDEELSFLHGDLRLAVRSLASTSNARVVQSRRFDDEGSIDEVMLNWPYELAPPDDQPGPWARVERVLAPADGSIWRSVLELECGGATYPILIRTPITRSPPLVVCSLLLDYERAEHAHLLANMLVYCALGAPAITVVAKSGAPEEAALLTRKLRLQGAAAVETGGIRFDAWPALRAREVMLPRGATIEEAEAAPGWREWLEAGGTLVTVDSYGRPATMSGASDADWVAQRWASWFASGSQSRWETRIGRSHLVLRVLERLHRQESGARAAQLGLPVPSSYADGVKTLLEARFAGEPHCEQTISATAAAYELHRLVGEAALGRRHAERVAGWLRESFETAHDIDKLTIARALEDQDLLRRAVAGLRGSPLTPLLVTNLCEAALAAGCDLAALDGSEAAEPDRALDGALVLSARYLAAVSDYTAANAGATAPGARPETIDRAIATIRQFGMLARFGAAEPSPPVDVDAERVSYEALAMLAFFGLSTTQTSSLASTSNGLSGRVVEYVVRESERLRARLAVEQAEAARVRHQAAAFRHLVALATVAAGVGTFIATRTTLGLEFSIPLALIVFASSAGGLVYAGWAPHWLEPLLTVSRGGPSDAGSAIVDLLAPGRRGRREG